MSVDTEPRHLATPPAEDLRPARHRTPADRYTLVAALVGATASTWLLYTQLLPFEGKVGFIVLWFFVLLAFQAGLTALTESREVVVDRVVGTIVIAAPLLIGAALLSVVLTTVLKGLPVLVNLNFLTEDMAGVQADDPFTMGGILHALVGTVIEVAIAVAIAMPLGVATAVYISEVGGRGARIVRTVVEAMTALPSIVAGLFIYTTCIVALGMQTSGFAASLALAVMALPIMARASEVVLRVVPNGLREASYALGAGRWQTVWKVVLPTARPGLATALILGVARAVGETAPLLLTQQPGSALSGGQQQRLCIARSLAVRPRVLLMDEPCSALDPTSTRVVEETIREISDVVTVVIVTHNMQQAARVSDRCAFFLAAHGTPGVIVEQGPTEVIFDSPQDERTADYVNGRFG